MWLSHHHEYIRVESDCKWLAITAAEKNWFGQLLEPTSNTQFYKIRQCDLIRRKSAINGNLTWDMSCFPNPKKKQTFALCSKWWISLWSLYAGSSCRKSIYLSERQPQNHFQKSNSMYSFQFLVLLHSPQAIHVL